MARNANALLATGIQLAVHQKFDPGGRLEVAALPRDNKATAHIRDGEFAALNEEVQKQLLKNM